MGRRDRAIAQLSPLLLCAIVCPMLTGCRDAGYVDPAETAPARATGPPADRSVTLSDDERRAGGIVVDAPRQEMQALYVSASAVLQLDETKTARVGSIVDGVVVATPVEVGTRVRQGARLASIHSQIVHEAWAGYRRALAEGRRSTSELAFLREAEGRASRLLTAKAASQQEAERARTNRMAGEEALAIAESEVRRATEALEHLGIEASVEGANAVGDVVPVRAAVGGVVLERLVTPGTAVTAGAPLFVVSDLSRLWAIAEVDETVLSSVTVGRDTELTVAAYPERVFTGRVLAVGDTVDPETRRVKVRVAVPNADGALKPQMFANVRLATAEQQPILTVPADAVQKLDQEPVVFVEQAGGRFVARPIRSGGERDGRTAILDGITATDRVAVSGAFLLKSKFLEASPGQ